MKLIEPGTRIRFRRGDGTEQEDTVRSVFWQEAGPGPDFVPPAAVAVTLTEHSWCYAADITGWLGADDVTSCPETPDDWDDEDDFTPREGDGFVTLSGYRFYVSLGGYPMGIEPDNRWARQHGYPDADAAVYELAVLMAGHGEFPPAWMEGEHGPSSRSIDDEVRGFHDQGGDKMRPLAGVEYEDGTEVRFDDCTMDVVRDYGELGIWLAVTGDWSAGEAFVRPGDRGKVQPADLMSEARGWISDCNLIRGEVADLGDADVRRIVDSLYDGQWPQFMRDFDPGKAP